MGAITRQVQGEGDVGQKRESQDPKGGVGEEEVLGGGRGVVSVEEGYGDMWSEALPQVEKGRNLEVSGTTLAAAGHR